MKKIYVLDTNVLLQEPNSIYTFEDNDVVIPAVVLEEVDTKKRHMEEIGRNARQVSRIIDKLRLQGKLHKGIPLPRGGKLKIELNHRSYQKMEDIFIEKTNDNRILAVALNLHEEEKKKANGRQVILVSKDMLMRVKADALGITAEDFLNERAIHKDEVYTGFREIYTDKEVLDRFYKSGDVPIKDLAGSYYANEFFILKNRANPSQSAMGIVNSSGILKPCNFSSDHVWGIKPRNAQQTMALELLLRKDIPLVTMVGKAGTGKTLMALAAGLMQIEDLGLYKKMLVARPIVPVGKDIGYLPGEKEEKLRPWVQPIYDNLEHLFNVKKPGELDGILSGLGSIQVEALTYIRGRSIPDQLILIDEAQNLTRHEVKTILTRIGEGSKIILLGDTQQIDHPYLDEYNNGLIHVVEKFKEHPISGHVKLIKGERSPLAQLAADYL
ncbi:PhoH family protein [Thalassobacillus pellis]|uniref:PhoH family protein n=1 Tax=Thalassobacillus pellis TaxID=748008 RepID=UPI00196092F4|nr:PhoH family protein [Thalassobacillus pellis]MBM7552899.1 PhoH-like ATPase [Thalassobacillus pellis]